MPQSTRRWITQKVDELRNAPQLPFHDLLDPATVNQVLDKNQVSFRDRIFSPLVTLWTFLSQVLSLDHSCREAVARLIAFRVSNGQEPCGPETGSYCKAEAEKAKAQRNPAAMREHEQIFGQAPSGSCPEQENHQISWVMGRFFRENIRLLGAFFGLLKRYARRLTSSHDQSGTAQSIGTKHLIALRQ
jgi:hypothetical protein